MTQISVFLAPSTPVRSYECGKKFQNAFSSYYNCIIQGFRPETEQFDVGKCKRLSQGEENDANFSFIAPSSEE